MDVSGSASKVRQAAHILGVRQDGSVVTHEVARMFHLGCYPLVLQHG